MGETLYVWMALNELYHFTPSLWIIFGLRSESKPVNGGVGYWQAYSDVSFFVMIYAWYCFY